MANMMEDTAHLEMRYIDKLTRDIKKNGIKNPIILAQAHMSPDGFYDVEGSHRLYIANELGIETIPAYVKQAPQKPVEAQQAPSDAKPVLALETAPDFSTAERRDVLSGKTPVAETRGKGRRFHGSSSKIGAAVSASDHILHRKANGRSFGA